MPDIQQSISLIHHRLKEASLVLDVCAPSVPNPDPSPGLSWAPPPLGWIKINTDAALSSSKVSLAVLARDHNGVPIKAWARISKNLSPIQAEAEALLWAVKLAKRESWSHIIFEGDAKGVFDSLTSKRVPPDWSIRAAVTDILALSEDFQVSSFNWVKRTCNSAAHSTAKFALNFNVSCFFNKENLPPAILATCKIDSPRCSFL
ncbi:uncharacterized protein LOC111996524 [Quercus suber]|uniref:uncharacterized protein LOC111996524 n=1 Tax=Quercus suber TaxID=58331 RepID=UPI000CE1A9D2|nr:uncharacterized protein LOC111996524 [Quercus suber]